MVGGVEGVWVVLWAGVQCGCDAGGGYCWEGDEGVWVVLGGRRV